MPGGFVGVDVFFVISGFLISGIIFDEMQDGSFSLRTFYARRVRRIFPALVVVLIASLVAGWWLLMPAEMLRLGAQAASSAGFVANFYFWLQSGYFSPDAQTLPLLHLWSLGVEEQFYIVWPLILLAIRNRPGWTLPALIAVGGSSFLLNIVLINDHAADFYSPLTRAWELMAGALVAWLHARAYRPPAGRAADVATLLGLAAICAAGLLLDARFRYPGWFACIPVLGSALVVWGGAGSSIGSRFLSLPVLTFVGRISYPLYLWHWPVLVFAVAFKLAPLTSLEIVLALAVSFPLAWLTYALVERRFRTGAIDRARLVLLGAGMATAACAGAIVVAAGGFAARFPAEIVALAEPRPHPREWRLDECLIEPVKQTKFAAECLEDQRPLVLVWGDSIAAALMPGLRKMQLDRAFGLAQLTPAGCPPVFAVEIPGSPRCREINQAVLQTVKRVRPDVVLLQSRGTYLPDEREGLGPTIRALRELGISRVILLGPPPIWKRSLANEALNYFIKHHEAIPARHFGGVHRSWNDAEMRAFANGLGAEYVSTWDTLCNTDGCLTRLSESPVDLVIFDQSHFSENGSKFFIEANGEKIMPRDIRR